MGLWEDIFVDIDKDEFREQVTRWLECVDIEWVLEAQHEGKVRPVGLIMAEFRAGGRAIEPHVDWFPWASTRVKYESLAHFIREIRKEYKVFVYSTPEDEPMWKHLKRHRLMVRGCPITEYFGPDEDAVFYYTKGPFV